MAIKREYNIPLSSISTFRIGGTAKEVVTLETEEDIKEFFQTMPKNQKWFLLGGGSNVVFPDGDCNTLIVHLAYSNISIEKADDENVFLTAGAGTIWDDVVAHAVAEGLSGIEALSAIPGSTGATPVQNVGAYGVEIKDVLHSVRVFDVIDNKFVTFSNEECKFAYRDSMFKNEGRKNGINRYIITEVTLLLSKDYPDVPQYPGVAEYLAKNEIRSASLQDIRNAIIEIRAGKLPNPKDIASVGSFFKNAFVSHERGIELKKEFPTLAVFPVNDTTTKIGAGSLIDTLGLKGKKFGNLSIYKGNALVLVNEGGATREELSKVVAEIVSQVKEKYGITLEPEPELLNF